jgi:hypothetical protein
MSNLKNSNSLKQRRMVVTNCWGERNREMLIPGHNFSVTWNKNIWQAKEQCYNYN